MLRDAWRLIRTALPERRSRLAGLIALGVAAALAEGAGLMLLVVIINGLPDGAAAGGMQLEQAILVYVVIVAAAAATVWARTVQTARLRLETADRLRREAFGAVLNASWPALRKMPSPAITQLVTIEAARVGMGIDYLMSGIAIATRVPVLFAVAFRLSPLLATVTLAAAAALALVSFRSDRLARRSGERMISTGRAMQTRTAEALLGRRVVKAFGLERARIDAFSHALEDARTAQLAQQRAFAGAKAVLGFLVAAATAVALWLAVRVMGLDLGSALIFAAAYGRLGQSVLALRSSRQIVLAALPAEAAVRSLVDEARAAAEPAPESGIQLPAREIALQRVSLVYDDGTKALSGVSVSIPVGSITAIVGPSGAGKSTLADLIMGLAIPTDGTVALDGRPLDAAGRRAWRTHVGYVPQDAFLFHEPIRDNLLAARPDAAEEDLWRALEAAGAAELVRALPDGLDTIAGERGTRLSGGEAQRIALARALLREPALLVLDEPTSALDAESEARIIATIDRLKGRHTIVIVAHRQALAAIADHTIALDRGSLAG